ncbi:MAG: hypothetical protein ACLPKB_25150 [Xanthobacteraceae bacterium]
MADNKRPARRRRPKQAQGAAASAEEQIGTGGGSLHELFSQQTRQLLDRADLDEEQKQSLLIAMSCPCCGAGGMSYTVKLKR